MNNLIHSGTNYAKRKPIARMFEPIRTETLNHAIKHIIAERNAKPERKMECAIFAQPSASVPEKSDSKSDINSTSPITSNSPKSPSSQPEFKVGDLVECLPFDKWLPTGNKPHGHVFGKTGRINWIGMSGEPCCVIDSHPDCHPLRALRQAETEPRKEDGWVLYQPNDYMIYDNKWSQSKNDFSKAVLKTRSGLWCTALNVDNKFNSWLELKRAMEKAK